MTEIVFKQDELRMMDVDKDWDKATLLTQEAVFLLKDIAPILKLNQDKVKYEARKFLKQNKNSWEEMGVRMFFYCWYVRMKKFAPFYLEHLQRPYDEIPKEWDSNRLLASKGTYLLVRIAERLPIKGKQLRHQAKKLKYPKRDIGIWKDKKRRAFLVHMPTFAPICRRLREGDFEFFKDFEQK
jgi:hypothetical protein